MPNRRIADLCVAILGAGCWLAAWVSGERSTGACADAVNLFRKIFGRGGKGSFARPVEAVGADGLVSTGEEGAFAGEEAEISPMFVNMQAYVAIAERLPLRRLSELMECYFETCGSEIAQEGGTIDKFIGDSVVAMFGAPLRTSDHGLRACIAALKIQKRVARLRTRFQREPERWPEPVQQLRVRIGINTGVALVGAASGYTRFNCTMMGDEVNLAARLESGAKAWGVWTLCSETTKRACDRTFHGRVLFRCLGRVVVKGRTQPSELFEAAALDEDATPQLRECVRLFETGLARLRDRDWEGAIDQFKKSAYLERDQPGESPEIKANPSTIYLEMAQSFRANPHAEPFVI